MTSIKETVVTKYKWPSLTFSKVLFVQHLPDERCQRRQQRQQTYDIPLVLAVCLLCVIALNKSFQWWDVPHCPLMGLGSRVAQRASGVRPAAFPCR